MDLAKISVEEACERGELYKFLEDYINFCTESCEIDADAKKSSKKSKRNFPNIAGFCRFCHIGICEYEYLASKYPSEFQKLQAVFEDEALNSEISPTILAAYLKKWIGYEKNVKGEVQDGQLKIIFDHDIWEDGK